MKNWLNTYFAFSKREFNGLLTLIVLIVLISVVPYTYGLIMPGPDDSSAEQRAIKKLILNEVPALNYSGEKQVFKEAHPATAHSLFYFDPNTASPMDWQKLGLSAKQSASIIKYVAKGGKFRKREDLQKLYVISNDMYKKLAPFVQIAVTADKNIADLKLDGAVKYGGVQDHGRPEYKKSKSTIIEVNGADSAALDLIRGIGPAFASRIIKYRERIGGFYNKEQLMEVFGLDSVKYNEIKSQIAINQALIRKININTAAFTDFKDHPYIRYKQVNALIEYRKQHGNYSNIAELNKVAVLDHETIVRLAPYLTF